MQVVLQYLRRCESYILKRYFVLRSLIKLLCTVRHILEPGYISTVRTSDEPSYNGSNSTRTKYTREAMHVLRNTEGRFT